jgi:hypothetical protein
MIRPALITAFVLLLPIFTIAQNENKLNRDPATVKFVTSDIDNFWRAFDLAAKETDTDKRIAIYQNEYLDKGSDGLKDFIRLRIKSAKNLVATIDKMPKFYASIRPETLRISGMEKKMRANFRKFKKIYPDAVFPDVYFLIGVSNTGGTTGPSGLLIGAEMYGRTSATPDDELPSWLKRVLGTTEKMPAIVAHESCHYNQSYDEPKTLLGKSIQEGSCDFIGELISGDIINAPQKTYGNAHQADLWQQFQTEMNGSDFHNWLYNGNSVTDRPGDLGYYMGYRIADAYYRRTKNKRQAVRDILNIKDIAQFLTSSGYAGS